MEYAPTGDLHRFNDTQLAAAVELDPAKAKSWVEALCHDQSRWIDRGQSAHGESIFRIHDWPDYAGKFLKNSRWRDKPEKWKDVESVYGPRLTSDEPNNGHSGATQEKLTVPNQPTIPTNNPPNPPDGGLDIFPGFDEFWKTYPEHKRKVGRKKCLTKWKREKLEAIAGDVLIGLAGWNKHWAKDGFKFLVLPHRFLNEEWWTAAIGANVSAPKPMTGKEKVHRAWLSFTQSERRELLIIVKDRFRTNIKAMQEIEALVANGGLPADWLLDAFVEAREINRKLNIPQIQKGEADGNYAGRI